MEFKLYEQVVWENGAQGHVTKKEGPIVKILPPGEVPAKSMFPDLYRKDKKEKNPRTMESYVVKVGNIHYWPWPVFLRHANQEEGVLRVSAILDDLQKLSNRLSQYPEDIKSPMMVSCIGSFLVALEEGVRSIVVEQDTRQQELLKKFTNYYKHRKFIEEILK